ncbi:MAG: ATP-binding protein [Acidithiobacillus sp.]
MDMVDQWHHPRGALAQDYLRMFDLGLVSARGLFAKRRMGKTEFLRRDLLPLAEAAGYRTAYANLWEAQDDPERAIIGALAEALEPRGKIARWVKKWRAPRRVTAAGHVGPTGGSLSADFSTIPEEPANLRVAFHDLLNRFDDTESRLLLALDEAQVLANVTSTDFTHALRAALDIRKDRIKVLFAGSSEATLRRMFGRASEPFYNWAVLEPFPLLGDSFVLDMVARTRQISRCPLSDAEGLRAFAALNETPEFFRGFLNRYLLNPDQGVDAAIQFMQEQVFSDQSFARQWEAFAPVDREMLRMLAEGISDLHGQAARTRVGEMLGIGRAVPLHTPAQALRRLQDQVILTRIGHGKYRFEDEAFADWIRQQPD